jgi:hypothetical protein
MTTATRSRALISLQWAEWMESHECHVANDIFEGVHVSTVFLGIDHNFGFDASPPVLFETMIFGGPMDGFMDRYHTREEALQGHAEALTLVKLELEMLK